MILGTADLNNTLKRTNACTWYYINTSVIGRAYSRNKPTWYKSTRSLYTAKRETLRHEEEFCAQASCGCEYRMRISSRLHTELPLGKYYCSARHIILRFNVHARPDMWLFRAWWQISTLTRPVAEASPHRCSSLSAWSIVNFDTPSS